MSSATAYSDAFFGFVLDNANLEDRAGQSNVPSLLRSIEGGFYEAAVLEEGIGSQLEMIKHVGTVDPKPIQLELGLASSRALLQWISETWKLKASKRSGRIDHGTVAGGIIEGRFAQEFFGALLTEVKLPTLSAEGNDDAYLRATIQPARLGWPPPDHNDIGTSSSGKQLHFSTVNYALEIEGQRIMTKSIDGLSVKQHVAKLHTGRSREPELVHTGIEIANFTVTCNQGDAGYFIDWYKERMLNQTSGEASRDRGASISLIGRNKAVGEQEIFELKLGGVGLYGLEVEKSKADSPDFKRVRASLYAETIGMELSTAFDA